MYFIRDINYHTAFTTGNDRFTLNIYLYNILVF